MAEISSSVRGESARLCVEAEYVSVSSEKTLCSWFVGGGVLGGNSVRGAADLEYSISTCMRKRHPVVLTG